MAKLGIKDAFARYGAVLRNVQWSVSAWAPDGALVVSVWAHHARPRTPGALVFEAHASRWKGPGNTEFRENVTRALETGAPLRLVVVTTDEADRVEASEDASKIRKDFSIREDLLGKVEEWDGNRYVFRFTKA